jgi:sporulation protein YlmC with PRC-barrel domain
MKRAAHALGAALIGVAWLVSPAWSQGAQQTVGLVKVDPQTVATGYRATKIIGASVINDANDTIGKIDDLIVSPDGKTPFAVLTVGGFLGLGDRRVVVPYSSLKFADNKIVLPGASKDELRALPEYKYAKD